jgi:hypothetical protein
MCGLLNDARSSSDDDADVNFSCKNINTFKRNTKTLLDTSKVVLEIITNNTKYMLCPAARMQDKIII